MLSLQPLRPLDLAPWWLLSLFLTLITTVMCCVRYRDPIGRSLGMSALFLTAGCILRPAGSCIFADRLRATLCCFDCCDHVSNLDDNLFALAIRRCTPKGLLA